MYYHGVMVPVLILLYLITQKTLHLKVVNERVYYVCAILAVLFVGAGSVFSSDEGMSTAVIVQIIGMVMTDCLGIILLIGMAAPALKKDAKERKTGAAFRLLFFSIGMILIAAPFGHLAGWCHDIGIGTVPGTNALLNTVGMTPADFQDGLTASHSHLIVAALLCGLAAVAAIYFQYQARAGWRKRISDTGLWVTLISLLSATGIYVVSAVIGWEPPTFFVSGPSGIPLDDIVLSAGQIGILLLMVGLSGRLEHKGGKSFSPLKADIRIAVFVNWIAGFAGSVLPGIFIELNEGFYGAGESPAPGALNDNIFIRAHLLYSFFLLPVFLAVLLAVGSKYNNRPERHTWARLFARASVFGMATGLAGEILWFTTNIDGFFVAAVFIMVVTLTAGIISLWPCADASDLG